MRSNRENWRLGYDRVAHDQTRGGSTRCKQKFWHELQTKEQSSAGIYATTPIWPSFREASKHRFKPPTYATKEASYVCQCQSLDRLSLIWASHLFPWRVQQGLPDKEGRGQSRKGLRPSQLRGSRMCQARGRRLTCTNSQAPLSGKFSRSVR